MCLFSKKLGFNPSVTCPEYMLQKKSPTVSSVRYAVLIFVEYLKDGIELKEAQKTDKEMKLLAPVIQLGFCVSK